MNKMYFVVGDWSDDGHGKSEKLLVQCNKEVGEVQEAYKAACRLVGVSFNIGEDYTGVKRHWKEARKYQLCCEYQSGFQISKEAKDLLLAHGYDWDAKLKIFDEGTVDSAEVLFYMWRDFVKLALPDVEFDVIPEGDYPCINGYWNDNLNVGFGYSLYE